MFEQLQSEIAQLKVLMFSKFNSTPSTNPSPGLWSNNFEPIYPVINEESSNFTRTDSI